MFLSNRPNLKLWLVATLAITSLSTATSLLFKNEDFVAKMGLINTAQEVLNKVATEESRNLAAAVSMAELPVNTTDINSWIAANFKSATPINGSFNGRTTIESPSLIKDASANGGKYGFFIIDKVSPDDRRVALVNVTIKNQVSSDSYGGGIGTSRSYAGEVLFLSNVYIEPNWPTWKDYKTTNYDGMTLDGTEAIYAENVTIKNWNADAAMDIKSNYAQLVNLTTIGKGHRTLRFWRTGPHYIVASTINNTGEVGSGSLIWMKDCTNTKLYVYKSTFNGSATLPSDKISCDGGSNPKIIYLTEDPRTTGEMHPMFSGTAIDTPNPVASSFSSGDSVATTDSLNVRTTANGSIRSIVTNGTVGTVGSQSPISLAGYTWVYVNFANGVAGWVTDSFLVLKQVTTTPTPPTTPTTPTTPSTPSANANPLLIDSGSTSTFTDGSGRVWSSDYGADGSVVNRGSISIANTSNDALYQTERWGLTKYSIPVTNGNYTVRLHFAETYSGVTSSGKRVFSVNVEGKSLSNLDIYKEVGKNKALIKTFDNVEVSDGVLSINFTKNKDNPLVNGVEIVVDTTPSSDESSNDDVSSVDDVTNPSDNPSSDPTPTSGTIAACTTVGLTEGVNLRQDPSLSARIVSTISKSSTGSVGTQTEKVADGLSWVWLNFHNGRGGWVAKDYVSVKSTSDIDKSVGNFKSCQTVVTSAQVSVRESASLSGKVRTNRPSGSEGSIDPLSPMSVDGYTWVYVNFHNGRGGWVEQDYLTAQ